MLDLLFHIGPHYYYVFDLYSVEFEYIDDNLCEVLGYSKDIFSVAFYLENIHPDDVSYFLDFEYAVTDFFKKLKTDHIMHYKVSYDYRVKHSNGHYVRILQQVITIQIDSNGKILKTIGLHTDISHLKDSGKPKLSFIGLYGQPSFYDVQPKKMFLTEFSLLTKRENEILQLVVEGNSSLKIAELLFLSKHTVNAHRRNIHSKTNTHSVADLISKAVQMGWV